MWNVNVVHHENNTPAPAGFILTMWNVNSIYTKNSTRIDKGFILTMWNVNLSTSSLAISFNSVLY